jgi:hypothetical protein
MHLEPLAHNLPNFHPWIQRFIGILEDKLHAGPEFPKGGSIQLEDILISKKDLT